MRSTPQTRPLAHSLRSLRLAGAMLLLAAGVLSCGRGGQSPLAPGADLGTPDPGSSEIPTSLASMPWQSGASSLFGVVAGTIFPDGTVETHEVRTANAVGSIYDIDATQFFTEAPCTDCAELTDIHQEGDVALVLDFAIRHPFPSTLPRRDLHIFDVRGTLITPGQLEFPDLTAPINTSLTAIEEQPITGNPQLVLNADGFTTHFDYHANDPRYRPGAAPIPGNLNAFKRYFVDPTTGPFAAADPTGWNVCAMGAGPEVQSFRLNKSLLTAAMPFVFVVDARWGESATKPTRMNPSYYLPAFSRQEAWDVAVDVVSNNLQAGDTASSVELEIRVKDWQAAATVAESYPNPNFPNQVPWAGDVGRVDAQIAGVSDLDSTETAVSGGGTDDNPYLYTLSVRNDQAATAGTYTGLVAVRDDLFMNGQTGPGGLPDAPGVDQGVDVKDYTAYQVFTVDVAVDNPDDPPVADASATSPTSIIEGAAVTLNGSLSVDDGTIVKYEWNPGDGSGWIDRGTSPTLVQLYDLPPGTPQEIFTATLRVTDDAQQVSTDTVQITVSEQEDLPPTASAAANPSTVNSGSQVSLDGSDSTDDFGIVKYRWNPGDGSGWVDTGTNPVRAHTYTATSSTNYTATLEVTDGSGQLDTDTVQVTVNVPNTGPTASLAGTAPTSGTSPLEVQFNGSSSTDDQGIVTFEWDPGDGTSWHGTGAVPNFEWTYNVTATTEFTARLRVTDGGGLTDVVSTTITVNAAPSCGLTGISGPTSLNVGQTITLTAQGTSGSYQWQETSSAIQFVGSTTGASVQVQATSASANVNDIQVSLVGSGTGCSVQRNLTAYGVSITSPATARKQYVNFANGGNPIDGTDVVVTAQVTPAKSGVAVSFSFNDPDEPTFTYVAGTSWTSGGETTQQGETDTDPNDNNGDSLRPNGTNPGGAYTNGYHTGGGIYSHTASVNTNASGVASAIYRVSRYGGDNYTFTASADGAGGGSPAAATSPMVTVWRKYIVPVYSMKNSIGTLPWFYKPDLTQVNVYFGRAYIEAVSMDAGYGGMAYQSPINLTVADHFAYVETTGNYANASQKYNQTAHGQFACGIDRYSSSGTIGLWTGSYNPGKVPPPGVNVSDKPYNSRNYFTVASGRMSDLWNGSTLTELQNHVFVHEMGHSLGLPHNSSSTTGNPPLSKHGTSGIGIMAPATGPGISHYFTLSESRFLRGHNMVGSDIYRGPYYE